MSRIKITAAAAVVLFLLLAVSLIPLEMTVVPAWRFQVLDEAGPPMRNTAVRQVWRHHAAETEFHQADGMTDQNGFVAFPERTVTASWFRLARGAFGEFRLYSIYGTFGPFCKILVLSDKHYQYAASHEKGGNLPDRILVRRLKPDEKQPATKP